MRLQNRARPQALSKAMLEQPRALNALVAQIAHGQQDPMTELTGTSTTGTRGAAGRARLQRN